MGKVNSFKGKSHRKSKMGILFGIPILLFICGIILVSIGSYNYMRYAFYLSRVFIRDDVKLSAQSKIVTGVKKIKFPSLGDEFGELIISSASIDYPVFNGDDEQELLQGIGHFTGSTFPGENGNVVLAGHRNSVFANLKKVAIGDTVTFKTNYGDYIYKINQIKIIDGKDESIAQPANNERLTLYTCYPFDYIGSAPKRYVVICNLVKGTPLKELMLKDGV